MTINVLPKDISPAVGLEPQIMWSTVLWRNHETTKLEQVFVYL